MAKSSKGRPMKSPRGAITTIEQVHELLGRAKEQDVQVYHYDRSDGTYLVRTVTARSSFDKKHDGLRYFSRNGTDCKSGLAFLEAEDWVMFSNWWFLYACALKSKFPLCEINL